MVSTGAFACVFGLLLLVGAVQAAPIVSDPTNVDWIHAEWSQAGEDIIGNNNADREGGAVVLSGDGTMVAVGARHGLYNGVVRMYRRIDNEWKPIGPMIPADTCFSPIAAPGVSIRLVLETRLVDSTPSTSISDTGAVVVVGSITGAVTVFQLMVGKLRDAHCQYKWTQIGHRIAPCSPLAAKPNKKVVSISGDGRIVAVGANVRDENGVTTSTVGYYKQVPHFASPDTWEQVGANIGGDLPGSVFSVALSSDATKVCLGVNDNIGTSYVAVYKQDPTGGWVREGSDIEAGNAHGMMDSVDVSFSKDGSTVAVTAVRTDAADTPESRAFNPRDDRADPSPTHTRHVHVYRFVDGAWTQQGEDIYQLAPKHDKATAFEREHRTAPMEFWGGGEVVENYLDFSVSLNGDGSTIAVAEHWAKDLTSGKGLTRVYRMVAGLWQLVGTDIQGTDQSSGYAVSLDTGGMTLAIGTPQHDAPSVDAPLASDVDTGKVGIYYLSEFWSKDTETRETANSAV
jgi:hypothetical protein